MSSQANANNKNKNKGKLLKGGSPVKGSHSWKSPNSHFSPRMNGGISPSPHSSTTSGRHYSIDKFVNGKSKEKFTGNGGGISFHFWCSNFEMAAMSQGVHDMISPPPLVMAMIRDAIGGVGVMTIPDIMATMVEDLFVLVHPGPGHETVAQTMIDKRIATLMQFYGRRILNYEYNIANPVVRANLIAEAKREGENMKLKIELSHDNTVQSLLNSIGVWDRSKKDHADRSAKCFKLFDTLLGDGPKSVIRRYLLEGKFRTAYTKLLGNYSSAIGGAKNSADLLQMLLSFSWEPDKMSPDEFVDYFDRLIMMYESQTGQKLSDKDRDVYITNALARGHSKMYQADIDYADFEDKPLSWLLDRLSRTNSRAHMRNSMRQDQPPRREYGLPADLSDSEFAGMAHDHQQAHVVTCTKCNKLGHVEENCWSGLTCERCKKKGHLTARCTSTKDVDGRPFKLADKFEKKVQQK